MLYSVKDNAHTRNITAKFSPRVCVLDCLHTMQDVVHPVFSHLEDVPDDLHVLQDVMGSVQEEAGGHAVKGPCLVWLTVHLHKVPGAHGQQPRPLHQIPRMHIRYTHLHRQT